MSLSLIGNIVLGLYFPNQEFGGKKIMVRNMLINIFFNSGYSGEKVLIPVSAILVFISFQNFRELL